MLKHQPYIQAHFNIINTKIVSPFSSKVSSTEE
jgi:hypothetical protein